MVGAHSSSTHTHNNYTYTTYKRAIIIKYKILFGRADDDGQYNGIYHHHIYNIIFVCVTCHYRGSKIPRQVTMVGTLRRMCSVLQPAGTAGAAGTYLGPTIIYLLYRANVPLCAEEGWVQQNARVHAHTHTHTHPQTQTNAPGPRGSYTGRRHGLYVSYPPGGAVRWKKTPSRTGTHNNIVRSRIKNNSNNNIIMDVPIPRHHPSLTNRPLSVRFLSRCGARSPTHTI